jgi:hypothetical protein
MFSFINFADKSLYQPHVKHGQRYQQTGNHYCDDDKAAFTERFIEYSDEFLAV